MTQPDELRSTAPLLWSTGTGTTVWAIFQAAISGHLPSLRQLLADDPSLVRCHFNYRTPLYFAVRQGHTQAAALLLQHGADPLCFTVHDTLLQIARDRDYTEMRLLLEIHLAHSLNASPHGAPLAAAIRSRDLPLLRSLLDSSPHLLNAGDERSNQPIHWAVMTRQIPFIDELLARGANIDAQRADGARPIHLTNGDYTYRGWRDVPSSTVTSPAAVLAHLIARGAYLDIWTAAHLGNLPRVRELLDINPALANTNSPYRSYYLGCGSPLRNAAANGHIDIVRLLLDRGADPNLPEEGIAPLGAALYSAAANGHIDIARLLLQHGANPNAALESSADCLSRAINNNDQPMIQLLASHGASRSIEILAYYGDLLTAAAVFHANPSLANDPAAFSNAAAEGHDHFVRLMLRYQPGLLSRITVAPKSPALTTFLFDQGMDPNLPDWLGVTRLHEFARTGDIPNATLFLDRGASLHPRDEDLCSTPLAWAARFGQTAMVEFLLGRGAMPVSPDDPPWATPLAWATRRGHPEIVDLLQQASLHSFIEAACAPLHSSHSSGSLELAELIRQATPNLPSLSIHAAAILGDAPAVLAHLTTSPHAATAKGGPRLWDPLTHLCFSRYLRLHPTRSPGFLAAASALLDSGASPNSGFFEPSHQPEPAFESVLYGAAGVAHHPGLTQLLLQYGADPNDGEVVYHSPEWFDDRAMHALVESGRLTPLSLSTMLLRKLDWHHFEGVQWLLQHGADPTLRTPHGLPLPHALLRNNPLPFLQLLLDHGASPADSDPSGRPAFALAAHLGRGDALDLFHQRGFHAPLDPPTAFLAAAARGNHSAAASILQHSPHLASHLLPSRLSILTSFAAVGNTPGVRVLLDLGFPPAGLHLAVWRERLDTVLLLIQRGAPLEDPDPRGLTPLNLAVRALLHQDEWTPHHSTAIVSALLQAGANPASVHPFPSGHPAADALLRQYGREA